MMTKASPELVSAIASLILVSQLAVLEDDAETLAAIAAACDTSREEVASFASVHAEDP